jgi:DNA-binding transcriptional regulator PaaX
MHLKFEEFFDFIKEFGELIDTFIFRPYSLSISSMGIPNSTYNYRLSKFHKQGFVKKKKYKNRTYYYLTQKSKLFLTNLKNDQLSLRTDGLLTIIMFDIPENKHKHRDTFRKYLKKHNFIQVQKSVLVSRFHTSKTMIAIARELKIRQYITIFSGKAENKN